MFSRVLDTQSVNCCDGSSQAAEVEVFAWSLASIAGVRDDQAGSPTEGFPLARIFCSATRKVFRRSAADYCWQPQSPVSPFGAVYARIFQSHVSRCNKLWCWLIVNSGLDAQGGQFSSRVYKIIACAGVYQFAHVSKRAAGGYCVETGSF